MPPRGRPGRPAGEGGKAASKGAVSPLALAPPRIAPRPSLVWFAAVILVPVCVWQGLGWLGLLAANSVGLVKDSLSILAAVAFLFGTWQSIETRSALAALEIDPTDDETLRKGGVIISAQLRQRLAGLIWWEWRLYLVGTACLVLLFLISLFGDLAA